MASNNYLPVKDLLKGDSIQSQDKKTLLDDDVEDMDLASFLAQKRTSLPNLMQNYDRFIPTVEDIREKN